MDRYAVVTVLLLFVCLLGWDIRLELINEEQRQQNALQKLQIDDLQKKQRITAQDVGFLEKLVIEGK